VVQSLWGCTSPKALDTLFQAAHSARALQGSKHCWAGGSLLLLAAGKQLQEQCFRYCI